MMKAARIAVAVVFGFSLLAACSWGGNPSEPPGSPSNPTDAGPAPNIVFILTDDLSTDLTPYMSQVRQLAAEGVSFDNYFVANSLCCPSRGTIFTGKYPHNSGVVTNTWPLGGFGRFFQQDLASSSGPLLQAAGYRTGLMGKYLNQYQPSGVGKVSNGQPTYPAGYIPPGWNEWNVWGGGGYQEFNYNRAVGVDTDTAHLENAAGDQEASYTTDVLSHDAGEFITRATTPSDGVTSPFFLEISTFGTHSIAREHDSYSRTVEFPPAPRDRAYPDNPSKWPDGWAQPEFRAGDCGDPTDGGCNDVPFPPTAEAATFGVVPTNPPSWIVPQKYTKDDVAALREMYIERVQMAQSINDLIGQVRADLDAAGVLDNTYIVFSSDNGYHLGEHDLYDGKRTAYDHDIKVPLIIRPPGGIDGRSVDAIAQNTDLLPTFLGLVRTPEAVAANDQDGRSLLPFLEGTTTPSDWRLGAFVEQQVDKKDKESDPDAGEGTTRPPRYTAIRTADYLYVNYELAVVGASTPKKAEFYDLTSDPNELHNVYDKLSPTDKAALSHAIATYATCVADTCRTVDRALPIVSISDGG